MLFKVGAKIPMTIVPYARSLFAIHRNHELYYCYYTPRTTNKCNSNPCQNGATCSSINTCAGYVCSCRPHYSGTLCEHLYGNLRLKARYARNLRDSDEWLNNSDPYMEIIAYDENGNSVTKSTRELLGDTNPDWNQWLNFGARAWK